MDIVIEDNYKRSLLDKEYTLACQSGKIIIQQDPSGNQNIWLINDLEMLEWQGKTYRGQASGIAVKHRPVTIPPGINATVELLQHAIHLIKPFPSRHKQLLQLVATAGQQAIDLLSQNPAIAYLIVSRSNMLPSFEHYQHLLIKLLSRKRHQILALLHYPARQWMAQLLARIPAHECHGKLLNDLMDLYYKAETEKQHDNKQDKPATQKLKLIRHHIKYPSQLLFTLLNNEQYFNQVSTKFLTEVGGIEHFKNKDKVLYDLDEIDRISNEELITAISIPKINSLKELPRIHQNLTDQLNHVHAKAASRQVIFAPPVYKGTEIHRGKVQGLITPLQTGEELYQEGKTMNHCIFSYQPRISMSDGRLYAYHAQVGNEHASVLVAFPVGKAYKLIEARGLSNANISGTMRKILDEWLQDYSYE